METRLIIAYAIIAMMIIAGGAVGWHAIKNHRERHNMYRKRKRY
jgi:hypothetical protein